MTTIIKYHSKTTELAVLLTERNYWIGSFCKYLTHQNSEPPFLFFFGYWHDRETAIQRLSEMTGSEF